MPASAVGKKPYDSQEELNLIHRAKSGDQQAFETLYDMHRSRVFMTIQNRLKNEDASQEVTNTTFVLTWRFLSKFNEKSKFSTWITRIAINATNMHLRSQKRFRREVSLDTMLSENTLPSMKTQRNPINAVDPPIAATRWLATRDTNLEGVIDREVLERGLNKVPAQFREIIRLKFWEGLSLEEIQLKISAGSPKLVSMSAVKSRIMRGKNILMEEVEAMS